MQAELAPIAAAEAAQLSERSQGPLLRATKIAGAASFGAAMVVTAYLIVPTLSRAGMWIYLVAFLVVGTASSAVVVPVPGLVVLTVLARDVDPLGLAAAGAVGGALGELTGYWLGSRGRGTILNMRIGRWVHRQVDRRGAWVVPVVGLVPILPMSGTGMVAGLARYPVVRFFGAVLIGKLFVLFVALTAVQAALAFLGI